MFVIIISYAESSPIVWYLQLFFVRNQMGAYRFSSKSKTKKIANEAIKKTKNQYHSCLV